jgi:hypothetical protein
MDRRRWWNDSPKETAACLQWGPYVKPKELVRHASWFALNYNHYVTLVRSFMKWYFELLKNSVLVAAVFYFAQKTKSVYIAEIAEFSKFVLILYCLTYLYSWKVLLYRDRTPKYRILLGLTFVPLVGLVIFFAFTKTLNLVMADFVRAQSR